MGIADAYDNLKKDISRIYEDNHGWYGYRRITFALRNEGTFVNHKTVQKLMGQLHLKGKQKRIHYRSFKGEVGHVAPNVIDRDFSSQKPYQKMTTDVSQITIKNNKIFISPLLDMYNGEIITYTITDRPDLRMVTDMMNQALQKIDVPEGCVIHSDQGWHYQHKHYQKLLKDKGITQSMSRKGNCLDNAMMENFFGIMKSELLYLFKWDSMEQFKVALREYIKYYNNKRIKLRLNGMSPVQYRTHNM
jgi:putative transposase